MRDEPEAAGCGLGSGCGPGASSTTTGSTEGWLLSRKKLHGQNPTSGIGSILGYQVVEEGRDRMGPPHLGKPFLGSGSPLFCQRGRWTSRRGSWSQGLAMGMT